ncbi:MAG: peptidoglycan DD-metalloendopeptidase family protein [Alphaproteobacteria bacterium]|nr:peptidoglycan DD-metalloendopeptidase family protein [Alphaproteobacteria bacterium]
MTRRNTHSPATLLLATAAVIALGACSRGTPVHYYDTSLIIPGQSVTVDKGDTVYSIAREYNVPMREVIALNTLQPPYRLTAGQQLTMPAGSRSANDGQTIGAAPVDVVSVQQLQQQPGGYEGYYAPQPQQPAAPNYVYGSPQAGQYLQDPAYGQGYNPSVPPPANTGYYANSYANGTPSPEASKLGISAQEISPPSYSQYQADQQQVASIAPPSQAVALPSGAPSFTWPVSGPVLSGYGPKGQGLNNDGINIAAPRSAPVTAAANGTVVYAGNEMKGFGNLVLIRHEGGWITAYAHLERMLVERDAVVAQGDMIGTVGTSGGVSSPQLHFEIRQGGKPIDPEPYLRGR